MVTQKVPYKFQKKGATLQNVIWLPKRIEHRLLVWCTCTVGLIHTFDFYILSRMFCLVLFKMSRNLSKYSKACFTD